MRALLQRVSQGKVSVNGKTIAEIERGLVILLGVGEGDGEAEIAYLTKKIAQMRIFEDEQGKMN